MADNQRANRFAEIGRTGLKAWGGRINEEFLPQLAGLQGIRVYREMESNDPVIGAVLFAIEMLLRQASWRVEPSSQDNEDLRAAEFLESCKDDMSHTWPDLISELLSFLPYGWSWHEIVYKRRTGPTGEVTSKYNDGLIGWRKMPIRAQDTLLEWQFDDNGGVRAMNQSAPPDYSVRIIPIEKSLLFRTRTSKGSPEGKSILRNAYRSWYFKRRIEEIEGIGIERDLAGLPILTPPDKLDIWDEKNPKMVAYLKTAETLVRNVRRDEMEGVVLPFGWEFKLLTTGGRRNFDTNAIINRYDQRIAMTVLADFILLGHEKVGSFALSSDKTDLFAVALGAWLDSISEIFNRYAIPRLFALNPSLARSGQLPKLVHGDIESPNLEELANFIDKLAGKGVLTPDPNLEEHLRQLSGLPERAEDEDMVPTRKPPKGAQEDDLEQEDLDEEENPTRGKAGGQRGE